MRARLNSIWRSLFGSGRSSRRLSVDTVDGAAEEKRHFLDTPTRITPTTPTTPSIQSIQSIQRSFLPTFGLFEEKQHQKSDEDLRDEIHFEEKQHQKSDEDLRDEIHQSQASGNYARDDWDISTLRQKNTHILIAARTPFGASNYFTDASTFWMSMGEGETTANQALLKYSEAVQVMSSMNPKTGLPYGCVFQEDNSGCRIEHDNKDIELISEVDALRPMLAICVIPENSDILEEKIGVARAEKNVLVEKSFTYESEAKAILAMKLYQRLGCIVEQKGEEIRITSPILQGGARQFYLQDDVSKRVIAECEVATVVFDAHYIGAQPVQGELHIELPSDQHKIKIGDHIVDTVKNDVIFHATATGEVEAAVVRDRKTGKEVIYRQDSTNRVMPDEKNDDPSPPRHTL